MCWIILESNKHVALYREFLWDGNVILFNGLLSEPKMELQRALTPFTNPTKLFRKRESNEGGNGIPKFLPGQTIFMKNRAPFSSSSDGLLSISAVNYVRETFSGQDQKVIRPWKQDLTFSPFPVFPHSGFDRLCLISHSVIRICGIRRKVVLLGWSLRSGMDSTLSLSGFGSGPSPTQLDWIIAHSLWRRLG